MDYLFFLLNKKWFNINIAYVFIINVLLDSKKTEINTCYNNRQKKVLIEDQKESSIKTNPQVLLRPSSVLIILQKNDKRG